MNPERIGNNLTQVPGWSVESTDQAIIRNYHFTSFDEAMSFVDDVTETSKKAGHYPTIAVYLNQVKLRLTTPAADGLSDSDFELAAIFDHLAEAIVGF